MKKVDRDTFIKENMGLVGMVVKEFYRRIENHSHIDREDLKNVGTIGLIKAYDRFDGSFGTKFSTYAVPLIRWEINRFIRDNLETVKFGRRAKENYWQIVKANLINEKPGIISSILEIPVNQVEEAFHYYRGQYTDSLERPVYEGDGEPLLLGDILGDETDFDSNLEVQDFLSQFDKRTQGIMKLRLQNLSQKEIGKIIGVSQVQISRILTEARKQLEEGGITVSKKKNRDFNLAKKLAIETDLGASQISKQSGVSYTTAYNYIDYYRPTKEKIEEVEKKIKEEEPPVKTYTLSPEELEEYRKGSSVVKVTNNEPKVDIRDVVEEINNSPKESTIEDNKLSIEHRLDIPKDIASQEINPADGFMTMTFKLTAEDATSQLENIIKAMGVLGFKELNLTIQSQQIA